MFFIAFLISSALSFISVPYQPYHYYLLSSLTFFSFLFLFFLGFLLLLFLIRNLFSPPTSFIFLHRFIFFLFFIFSLFFFSSVIFCVTFSFLFYTPYLILLFPSPNVILHLSSLLLFIVIISFTHLGEVQVMKVDSDSGSPFPAALSP